MEEKIGNYISKPKKRIKFFNLIIFLLIIVVIFISFFFLVNNPTKESEVTIENFGDIPFGSGIWGNEYTLESIDNKCFIFLKSIGNNKYSSFVHDLNSNEFTEIENPPLKTPGVSNLVPIYNPNHPDKILFSFSGETNETCAFNLGNNIWSCSLAKYLEKMIACDERTKIFNITEEGPAEIAGLKEGMIIEKINGLNANKENTLKVLSALKPNSNLILETSKQKFIIKALSNSQSSLVAAIGIGSFDVTYTTKRPLSKYINSYICNEGTREYAIGTFVNEEGWEDLYLFCAGGGSIGTNTCLAYNIKEDKWSEKATYPESSEGAYGNERMCITEYNGKLYSLGGNHFPDVGGLYEYDPKKDEWKVLIPNFNGYPFQASICKRVGAEWHIFGGNCNNLPSKYCNSGFSATDTHFILNLDTLKLKQAEPNFPIPIQHAITCDLNENELLVYGGQKENDREAYSSIYKVIIK